MPLTVRAAVSGGRGKINQDIIFEKKTTTEAMALSMYRVELLDNINTTYSPGRSNNSRDYLIDVLEEFMPFFLEKPIPFLCKIMLHHIGQYKPKNLMLIYHCYQGQQNLLI